MRSRLSFGWGLAAVVVVMAGMLAASAVAVVGGKNSLAKGAIYACVTNDFGTLNLSSAKAKCPAGQRKIAWNVRGQRGARGPRGNLGQPGAAGNNGTAGKDGTAGVNGTPGHDGQIGPRGPTGETGHDGAPGSSGSQGDRGDPGPRGEQGIQGEQGERGEQGIQGEAGPVGIGTMTFSSSPIQMTILVGGLAGWGTALPIDGMADSFASILITHPNLDIQPLDPAIRRVQIIPKATSLTSIHTKYTSIDSGITQGPLTVSVGLYTASPGSAAFEPVPGASCDLQFPSPLEIGDARWCDVSGLSIPLPAGTEAVIVFSAQTGAAGTTTFTGQGAVSLGLE